MATLTKKERVRRTLAGEPVDHPPVSLWGHDFLREWSPEDLVAQTLEAYKAYDWDFIKLNPRATYFAEAWGARFERPTEQRLPRQVSAPIESPEDLATITWRDPRRGAFGEHLAALRMLLDAVGDEVDVLHTVFSPLAVLAQLCGPRPQGDRIGMQAFRQLAASDPAAVHAALQVVAPVLGGYARAAVEVGASGIFFAPLVWASRDIASEEFYREFGRPYDLQVLHAVRGAPFNVLHVCGERNMIDMLLDYPVAAFNWADHGAGNPSLAELRSRTSKAVLGGIDHTRMHESGNADVAAQARDALAAGRERTMVTGGCAVRPEAPREVRRAVVEAVRAA